MKIKPLYRLLVILAAYMLVGCSYNPMDGLRFACDPEGPSTCVDGYVCVAVQGEVYWGICTPSEEIADSGSSMDAMSDAGANVLVNDVLEDTRPVDSGDVVDFADYSAAGDTVCVPNCDGRDCGMDGCRGSCGTCNPGCSAESNGTWTTGECADGHCVTHDCNDGVVCTYNRCNAVKGGCNYPLALNWCLVADQCYENGDENPENSCEECRSGTNQTTWTSASDGKTCGCGSVCSGGACELVACDGRECGTDGCGGSCGTCGNGWECNVDGVCVEVDPADGIWYDSTSGLIWQVAPTGGTINFEGAKSHCADLELAGGGWPLPTIGELRSLIRGCPAMATGGSCGVTDSCVDYSDCRGSTCDGCASLGGPGYGGAYWPDEMEGEISWYWSSSWVMGYGIGAFHVGFYSGLIYKSDVDSKGHVRCVR